MEATSNPRKRARQSSSNPEQDAVKAQKQLKKRIQNRNSQKCYREKQLSYIRSLEDIVNSVGGGGAGGAGAGENEQKLIRKNRELEDALLRLRKKFMSLSTAAMVGAEDTIFQDILKNSGSIPEQISSSPAGLESKESNKNRVSLEPEEEIISPAVVNAGHHSLEDATLLPYSYLDNSTGNVEDLFSNLDGFHTMEVPPVFPSPGFPNLTAPQPQYIKRRRLHGVSIYFDVLGVEDTVRNAISQDPSTELVDCTSLAMRVMLKQSPLLEDYFNLMGGMYALTRVIVWRLKPTITNRDAIPLPFTPTTLQQHFPQHHYCIDFLPWGEMRDQILLHMGEVDFGQLGMDCLISMVQDIPQLNLALPSLEACFNLVEYLKNSMDGTGVRSLESALGLDGGVDEEIGHFGAGKGSGHRRVYEILKNYGLDRVVERKLNPKFAEKYPFLDVSRITTSYPVRSFRGEGQKFVGHQTGVGSWPISAM